MIRVDKVILDLIVIFLPDIFFNKLFWLCCSYYFFASIPLYYHVYQKNNIYFNDMELYKFVKINNIF